MGLFIGSRRVVKAVYGASPIRRVYLGASLALDLTAANSFSSDESDLVARTRNSESLTDQNGSTSS